MIDFTTWAFIDPAETIAASPDMSKSRSINDKKLAAAIAGGVGPASYSAPEPTVDDVKVEQTRRIGLLFAGTASDRLQAHQLKLMARALELTYKKANGGTLTAGELTEISDATAIWASINTINVAAATLEAMSPIPQNYTDNSHWV